jgi:hypothetical protein
MTWHRAQGKTDKKAARAKYQLTGNRASDTGRDTTEQRDTQGHDQLGEKRRKKEEGEEGERVSTSWFKLSVAANNGLERIWIAGKPGLQARVYS